MAARPYQPPDDRPQRAAPPTQHSPDSGIWSSHIVATDDLQHIDRNIFIICPPGQLCQSVLDVPVCELPIVQPELMGPTPSSWQYVRQGEKSTGPCWVLRPRLKAHKEQTGERRICRLTLTVEPSNASIIHVVVTATIIISFFFMTIIIITVLSSDHVISQPEQTK